MFLDAKKVHFIGIGGIGVSALAQWFLSQGAKVSGSNLSEEDILKLLREKGVVVKVGKHQPKNIPAQTELVIYTSAAPKDNPERLEAKKRKIPELSYAQAIGELTKQKFTIAICGSHGKSTTTAMAALLLVKAGLDPTVIVGTKLKEFDNSNFREGKSKYLVLEADEWQGAFWNYFPEIVIWTTLDKEHLDFYKNFQGVAAGFKKFLKNLPPNGTIIANGDDEEIKKIVEDGFPHYYFYSMDNLDSGKVRKVIQVPGEHNIANASSVMLLAKILKIPEETVLNTIKNYEGAWRRFEYKGELNGALIYDDYGHHPTEVMATLAAAKSKFPNLRLWCVFQPHQLQRTKFLFEEFTHAFDVADKVVLLDIYSVAGREKGKASKDFSSQKLADIIKKQGKEVYHQKNIRSAATFLQKNLQKNDVALIMGAGDIWKIYDLLL